MTHLLDQLDKDIDNNLIKPITADLAYRLMELVAGVDEVDLNEPLDHPSTPPLTR